MINFRYHIVSLMAVFLALSVGIVLGVTLRGPVDEGLVQQAAQDRQQVQDLRTQLDRRNALDKYRDAYALATQKVLTTGMLGNRHVALVTMPDAPPAVMDAVGKAVADAGGIVTRTAKINNDVFNPTKAAALKTTLEPLSGLLQLDATMSDQTGFGLALGRALLSKQGGDADQEAVAITKSLSDAGLVDITDGSNAQAELVIVVTAEATVPATAPEILKARAQVEVALKSHALGVVVAGPNSDNIDGTDVLTVRTDATAAKVLSTVDVADLSSGVTTVVMAAKEQLGGRHGHYGALARADAPLPQLPVR